MGQLVLLVYNGGTTKLATTSTGIDVTGTVTADGLTVDGVICWHTKQRQLFEHKRGATQTANRLGLGITNSAGAAYTYIKQMKAGRLFSPFKLLYR